MRDGALHYHRQHEGNTRWMADAACRDSDPRLFWPKPGESHREALAVCADCPVRQQCLDYAVSNGEHDGIWGGTSARQRRQIRRDRKHAA